MDFCHEYLGMAEIFMNCTFSEASLSIKAAQLDENKMKVITVKLFIDLS